MIRRILLLGMVLATIGARSDGLKLTSIANDTDFVQNGSLGECEGPCSRDRHCALGQNCFRRQSTEPVPGCSGDGVHGDNYCYQPPEGELTITGIEREPIEAFPLGFCEGDCNNDGDCDFGLSCFKRERGDLSSIPGCTGLGQAGWDYCYRPEEGTLVIVEPTSAEPLKACQGRCFSDADCAPLKCFQRTGVTQVPGCEGEGLHGVDYCYDPTYLYWKGNEGYPEGAFPLSACEGDCDDDADCDLGLSCFQRDNDEVVPGCMGHGSHRKWDFCTIVTDPRQVVLTANTDGTPVDAFPLQPCQGHCRYDDDCDGNSVCLSPSVSQGSIPGCIGTPSTQGKKYCSGSITYTPGLGTVQQHGLLLSRGLSARPIAFADRKVTLNSGAESVDVFHTLPDGAAVFANPSGDGWVYVSNSEDRYDGGVGALYFNFNGEVVDYQRLLSGTRRNCGGGKTFWGTFLSCEERGAGQIWEVDPWGAHSARQTIVGNRGAPYESAAFDNRDEFDPKFFVTVDRRDGPLVRFTPDPDTLQDALDTEDYTDLLHVDNGGAEFEYLIVTYVDDPSFPTPCHSDNSDGRGGYFNWTTDLREGRDNAEAYYRNAEGIDVQGGILYMTTKRDHFLFVLDLDSGTFCSSSTRSGAFQSQPDQVASLLTDGRSSSMSERILYFCEDGGENCGVHGRDSFGNFYTVLQAFDPALSGETTGLAFSPDSMFMYVSFQHAGIIFEVKRTDGMPFDGQVLDIKYHADDGSNFD